MASLGLVSPARRTANNTPSKRTGSSKKQVPIREYYIPASTSVQELRQATPRFHEPDDVPVQPGRRREAPPENSARQKSQSETHRAAPTRTAPQTALQAGRTTSVARRVLLRGPDSVRNNVASPTTTNEEHNYPSEQSPRNPVAIKAGRREAQSPSLRHDTAAQTFRYEQDRPLSRSQGSESRQQTFRTRVTELSTRQECEESPSGLSSRQHIPSASTISTDDLDSEFILQFARDHQLEIGAEVAQSLARAAAKGRSLAKSPLLQTPNKQPPPFSPLLSPHPPDSSSQPSPTQSIKPPRPPKSSRRLSASPSPASPAPSSSAPKQEVHAQSTGRTRTSEGAYASVFDDADEDDEPEPPSPAPPPVQESNSRRTSMSSTGPNRTRGEQSITNSSRRPSKPAQHNTPMTPHTPATPATPQIPSEHAHQSVSRAQETTTPQQQVSTAITLDESPSEAKLLISQFDDHSREDYERNRRLSSLLKGLGIQTRSASPELDARMETDEEGYEQEGEDEEEVWQPIPSSSSVVDMYSEAEDDEEGESIMLTGDSFETAPEEGTEIWTHGEIRSSRNDHGSRECMEYEVPSQDCSEEEDISDEEEIHQSDQEEEFDDHSYEKSWYTDDSRSKYSLRQSYGDKPQPLPPEFSIDDVRRSIIEQRASLGISDSVLAGILATDSFCMPDGVRLSIEQIAARLSIDRQKRGNENFNRSRRTTSGHTLSSLPYAGRERYRSVTSEASAHSPKFWLKERIPSYLSENTVEVVQEPAGGYDEADLPPLPTHEAEIAPSQAESTTTPSQPSPSWRNSALSMSEALALRPLPLELPSEDEASKAVENIPVRKRTRSVSAFQRLSSTFTGSSNNKPKSRKRLPSFLSGFVGSNKSTTLNATTAASTPSPATSIALVQPAKTTSLEPPRNHKRASTGPPRLVDIANEVTNTPQLVQNSQQPASPSESARSTPMGQLPGSTDTWRSTVPDHLYTSLTRTHSKNELKRQEVIYELYRTEESFVNGLKGVVRVFSQPLRTPQGRWIAGVPTPIARLLDWLDDIVYLHSQITAILADLRNAQGHLVYRIADQLLDFIPRLEVHQPYLIRFESVTKSIDDMLIRPDSDFGEFVRMQQALPECGAMPLSSFLLKPVQRLMKYPLFFKQLRDLTPAQHADFDTTQELLDVTDTMIRAMEIVKVREEEYESLKVFASKIVGLPTGLLLAKRDRRLLGQGIVHRVELSDSERHGLQGLEEEMDSTSYHNATSQPMSSGNGVKGPLPKSSARRPVLPDSAYGASPRPPSCYSDVASLAPSLSTAYSGSTGTYDSSTTFSPAMSTSLSSYSRTTSPSFQGIGSVRLPNGSTTSLHPESMLSSAASLSTKSTSMALSRKKLMSPSTVPASTLRGILKSTSSVALSKAANRNTSSSGRERPMQLFIFNDLVLFTLPNTPTGLVPAGMRGGLGIRPSNGSLKSHFSSTTLHATSQKDDATRYTVVDDWGVAKLIGATELSGRTEHENLFKLDLLPLWNDTDEKRPFTLRTAALSTTVYITLPNSVTMTTPGLSSHGRSPSSSTLNRDLHGRSVEQAQLLEALDRSYVHSLKEVTFSAPPASEQPKARSRSGTISARKGQTINLSIKTGMRRSEDASSLPRSPSQQRFKPTSTSDPQSYNYAREPAPHTPLGWQDPNSPTFDASSHRPDDIAEREERQFWSYRYKKVKNELKEHESFIDTIINSGLLHCPIDEIELIYSNLNGGTSQEGGNEHEGVMPLTLVNALREIKGNERRLKEVMKEAKKGVRIISGASNKSVGLAISYSRDTTQEEEEQYYDLRQTQHRTSEDSQTCIEDGDDETFEDIRYDEDDENVIDHHTRVAQQYEYRDRDEEISESEYDTEDQDQRDYESEEEEVLRSVRQPRHAFDQSNDRRQHYQPTQVARTRSTHSPSLQQQKSTTNVSKSPVARSSPRAPPPLSASMTRDTPSRSSGTSSQHRYGTYYRPSNGSSPAMVHSTPKMTSSSALAPTLSSGSCRSSPSLNSPKPTSIISTSPRPTMSTPSTPNHFALASQMRRERQNSTSHQVYSSNPLESARNSPNITDGVRQDQLLRRRSKEKMRNGIQQQQQREYSKQGRKESEIKKSESMETVFVVQRAQRVPIVRRL